MLRLGLKVADRLERNIGRIPAMFYGFSLTYCPTSSLANDGEALARADCPRARSAPAVSLPAATASS